MKLRVIPVLAALTLALLVASCVPPTAPSTVTSIEVSCDDFGKQPHISKEINVVAGNTFTVTLCSNATTGFKWSESAQISDQTVVQQMSHEFLSPENKGLMGAPGKEVWTFKALKKGTSSIAMEYSRPWQGGDKGEWTFNITVTAK